MNMISGIDIGNGYVKGKIQAESGQIASISIPSDVAYVTTSYDTKVPMSEVQGVMDDIYNQLDASFETPLVPDGMRRLFGTRGLHSGKSIEEFDVYSSMSKAQQPLSAILSLGCIAASALADYWNTNKSLPTSVLKVNVTVAAFALPIAEYMKYKFMFADGYKSSKHIVNIYNFEQLVTVEISFSNVQVVAEGTAAYYAIKANGEDLMELMLADARAVGSEVEGIGAEDVLKDITAKDVLAAGNIVGIDIGEGTVNFPVIQNERFNADASFTFTQGYGSVLNRALDRLKDQGFPFRSRKDLQDFLNNPSALNRSRYQAVQTIVDEEIIAFANEIALNFSKAVNRVGAYVEVVYVYGGGATPVKFCLQRLLVEKAKSFGGGNSMLCPILYLDSEYSRFLNREGLFIVAQKIASMTNK